MRIVVLPILVLLVLLGLINTSPASAFAPSPPALRSPTQACLAENTKEAISLYVEATEKALTGKIDGTTRHMVGLVQANMFLAIRMYSTHYDEILYPASRGDGVVVRNAVEYSIDEGTGVVMICRAAGNTRVPSHRRRFTAVSRFVANVDLRLGRLEGQVAKLPGIQEDISDLVQSLSRLRDELLETIGYFNSVREYIHPCLDVSEEAKDWEGRAKQIADKLDGYSREYEEMRTKQRKAEQELSVLWKVYRQVVGGVRRALVGGM